MDLLKLCFLTAVVCSAWSTGVEADGQGEVEEVLEDFPLDDTGGTGTDRTDEGGGESSEEAADTDLQENDLEDINFSEVEQTEGSRQELLRKVMSAAMSKPGARQRLAQVMPILRTMSATQRLALAGLVTSQLMAPPGSPLPQINASKTNLTDDLMIPISMDIASMFRGLGRDTAARSNLFRGDLYKKHPPYRRRPSQNLNRRNTEVPYEEMRPPPPPRVKLPKLRPGANKLYINRFPPPANSPGREDDPGAECEYFTNTVCLQVADYPVEAILKSIQNTPNKNAFEALRMDAKHDFGDIYLEDEPTLERRQGDVEPQGNGHMCSSKVEVARPKRARATSGQWKYVVNTGDYTQTLRLEMCMKPQQPCMYLADNFKSECTQVYNYHRLLTWDQKSGLTMDIFKVPTCCSCHVHNPSYGFVPAKGGQTLAVSESVRQPSQPVQPVRHATPPPRISYVEAPESNFVAADEPPAIHRLPPPKQILNRRPLGGLHNIPKRESHPSRASPPRRGPPQVLADPPEEHVRFPPQYENLLRRTISRNHSDFNEIRPKYHPVQPTLNQRHPELPVDSLLSDNTFSYVTSAPDFQPPRSHQDPVTRYHGAPPSTYATTPKRVVYQTTHPSTPSKRVSYQTTSPPVTTTRSMILQTTTTPQTPSSKRVNYSYHPIIDFFKTSVSAVNVGEDRLNNAEWTPINPDGPRVMPK